MCITYWMMGFERSAGKFFWYALWVLLTLLYYSFYGAQPLSLLWQKQSPHNRSPCALTPQCPCSTALRPIISPNQGPVLCFTHVWTSSEAA